LWLLVEVEVEVEV